MTGQRHCLLIPHYCHDRELASYLPRLADVGLPAIVVDDGSDPATRLRLRRVVADHPWVSLIERERNGGKGAAVIDGLRMLDRDGFTHAIAVDADGQHDPGDIPGVHSASQRAPGTVFAGTPLFGDDVPAARLHGRRITNLLAQIESGSRAIEDAMCGFRLYPVAAVLPLLESVGTRRHMEFDVEILVRIVWAGLPLRYFPTRVTYPRGARSHFRMIADNLRLSGMHAYLLSRRGVQVVSRGRLGGLRG